MKKINLKSITQKEILQIEKQFERIALNKIRNNQEKFRKMGLKIEAAFGRVGNEKEIGKEVQPSDCFENTYNSLIFFSVAYLNGTDFHDNEDGYCVDHLDIWVCERRLFSGKAGYLSDLESDEEIAKEIQNRINELYLEATEMIEMLNES
ncbi:hypothetical protein [Bacillus velezensis]|uniref:hypothetical protein n=1 Tax=Bacillus velezensis TaxID=492670 RepID=UPI000BA6B9E3|nr:hypothetical protein [Bacillus velezensis]NGM59349.1 hypothetical protein [Bacillus velezensis]PAE76691.1 hypothetical protein CHH82_09065 [Bacillus velezensis]UQX46512.1 hypothetical protein M5J22_18660 [Bacillus velezensis]WKN26313.1 hypothetical protein QPR36_18165 [Bacillus velezensis]